MNKLLNTQLYNRKCLVIANNPAAQSYEEALKKEEVIKMDNTIFYQGNSIYREYIHPCNIYQNIGKPLTLDRVLKGLGNLIKQDNYNVVMEVDTGIGYDSVTISLTQGDEVLYFKWSLGKLLEQQAEHSQEDLKEILSSFFLLDINGLTTFLKNKKST